MNDHDTPPLGARRGRRAAIAGLGVATLVGGLIATAAPATAATPVAPTLTLTVPSKISNDNTVPAEFTIGIDNSAAGTIDLTGKRLHLAITLPSGLTCAQINNGGNLTEENGGTHTLTLASAATLSTCDYVYTFVAGDVTASGTANDKATYKYEVTINGQPSLGAPITGDVTSALAVETMNGTTPTIFAGPVTGTTSTTANQAAVFSSQAPPPGRMTKAYSFQLITTPAFPATASTYEAVGYKKNTDGTWNTTPTVRTEQNVTVGTATHGLIDLRDSASAASGFYLDATTGQLVYGSVASGVFTAGAPASVYYPPVYTWTVVANNGAGGASTAADAKPPVPAVKVGDVQSLEFTLPVLFTDVNTTSPFASEIYTLAADNIVQGYATGAYGTTLPVSRQAFAAYTVRLLNLIKGGTSTAPATVNGVTLDSGPCTTASGASAFWDVNNANPFCQDIKTLASLGITKGYSNGGFQPAASISRQAIASFFFRLQSAVNGQTIGDAPQASTGFKDVSASNPFSGDIKWMVDNKITTGYSDGTFRPARATSRQANAAFLLRLGQLNKQFS